MTIKNNIVLFLLIYFVHNVSMGQKLIDKGDYWLHIPYTTIYCADNDTAIGSSYKIPIPKTCIEIEYSDNQYLYKLADNQYIMIVGYSKYDLCGLRQKKTIQDNLSIEDFIEMFEPKYSNCVVLNSLAENTDRETKILHIEQCQILLLNIKKTELYKIEKILHDYFEINVNDKINQEYMKRRKLKLNQIGQSNVLQSTAYYPSGVPLTPNTLTPQTIKLHTGKDYFDLQGAGWYDNQARYYDCLLPTFKSQDPLAEKYPWLSPYCHCANNPLRFVDIDGKDIWEIDERGEIKYHKKTNSNDQFHIVDNEGNRIKNKSIVFDDVVIERFSTQLTKSNKSYDVYRVRGDENATTLFEFFANNTDVEWSKFALGEAGDSGLNYITTGHSENSEPGVDIFQKQLRYNYTLRNCLNFIQLFC